MNTGTIIALHRSAAHTMQKFNEKSIRLLKGLGVEGDAHLGKKVKHRSRVRQNPDQPNLRQIHLIQVELLAELSSKGFRVASGQMGENVTTSGIALLDLPRNTILHLGNDAAIQITGLRNPCHQLNGIQKGLMQAVLDKDEKGALIRKAGVMGIVLKSGSIKQGDLIQIELPSLPHDKLEPV